MKKFIIIYKVWNNRQQFESFLLQNFGWDDNKMWPELFDNVMVIKSEDQTTEDIFNKIEEFRKKYGDEDGFTYTVAEIAQSNKEPSDPRKEHPVEMRGMHLVNFWNWLNGCQ